MDTVLYQGKEIPVFSRFNMTLKELESAVQYAKEHGVSEHKTVTISNGGGEIGGQLFVAPSFDKEAEDITDYDAA